MEREIEALSIIPDHENIIKLYKDQGSQQYLRQGERTVFQGKVQIIKEVVYYLVQEFAFNGEFFDFVQEFNGFDETITRSYFVQILNGLMHIYQNNYCHRDLKTENILMGSSISKLKIADFGFSTFNNKYQDNMLRTRLGTPTYQSPEMLIENGSAYDPEKVDVFALGVILFMTHAWAFPFSSPVNDDTYYKFFYQNNIKNFWDAHSEHYEPNFFSESFKNLVTGMFHINPGQRFTLLQISNHQWIKNQKIYTSQQLEQIFAERYQQRYKQLTQDFEKVMKLQQIQSQPNNKTQRRGRLQVVKEGEQIMIEKYNTFKNAEGESLVFYSVIKQIKQFLTQEFSTFDA